MSQYERVAGEGEMSHHSFVVCKIFLKNLETPMYHKKKPRRRQMWRRLSLNVLCAADIFTTDIFTNDLCSGGTFLKDRAQTVVVFGDFLRWRDFWAQRRVAVSGLLQRGWPVADFPAVFFIFVTLIFWRDFWAQRGVADGLLRRGWPVD